VGLAAALAIEPVKVFLLLTTAVTMGGVVAGTFLSTLWFIRVLRRSGLRVRFTPRVCDRWYMRLNGRDTARRGV
jgi:hypothetical protein